MENYDSHNIVNSDKVNDQCIDKFNALDEAEVDDEVNEFDEADEADDIDNTNDDSFIVDKDAGCTDLRGTIIYYDNDEELNCITRKDIVDKHTNEEIKKQIEETIDKKLPICFMPIDIEETNKYQRDGSMTYLLKIYGILKDGTKVEVNINDIRPYFEIRVPTNCTPEKLIKNLRFQMMKCIENPQIKYSVIYAKPIRGRHQLLPYIKLEFNNLQTRKKALDIVIRLKLETASDDQHHYYRKVAREYKLPISEWAILEKYKIEDSEYFKKKSPLCEYIFIVSVLNFKRFINPNDKPEILKQNIEIKSKDALMTRDRTLILTWDIEAYSSQGMGDLPNPSLDTDVAFMICATVHWKDDVEPLHQFCIVNVPSAPDLRWTTIVCRDQKSLLMAFALVIHNIAPDIIIGFNDSGFDWPFIIKKAEKCKILHWMVDKISATKHNLPQSLNDINRLEENILKWNFKTSNVKITPDETMECKYLKLTGYIAIDVRVCFKKLMPKSETQRASSLKFYLDKNELPGKVDMPIRQMWKYYEDAFKHNVNQIGPATREYLTSSIANNMRSIAYYCIVDAISCQRLLVKRNVINDYREVSALAYVALNDSHYYAGGMKVCNLLGAGASESLLKHTMINNENRESGKYPGAYVFFPEKGIVPDPIKLNNIEQAKRDFKTALSTNDKEAIKRYEENLNATFAAFESDRPVTGLDFASLYPSLIMAYNLSPEKIITDEEEAKSLAQTHKLHEINFTFNNREIRAWSILHENNPEEIGLYPRILIELFNKRAEVKKLLNKYAEYKELFKRIYAKIDLLHVNVEEAVNMILRETEEKKTALEVNLLSPKCSAGATIEEEKSDIKRRLRVTTDQILNIKQLLSLKQQNESFDITAKKEYDRICFEYVCTNARQSALKVYMNTFYGEAGNSLSPFFLLELAGGVTISGQYNIKTVADFVKSKGFKIKYGDTDSLYLVAPGKYFEECDKLYAEDKINREEWFTHMVRITMRALNQIRDEVNTFLHSDNGTPYLKMAYEEVLYPVVFTGKKKYFGIPHINEVNFTKYDLFIKGIEVIKQGQTKLAKIIADNIIKGCLNIHNDQTVQQIVEIELKNALVSKDWQFEDFIKTDAWRPHKKNLAVHRFMNRMAVLHAEEKINASKMISSGKNPTQYLYEPPEPGERFSYVIVQKDGMYDIQGRKIILKKGDKMEYERVAKLKNMQIDISYYMIKYVSGICARFINGDPEFMPFGHELLSDREVDKKAQDAAKRHLESLIKHYNNNPASNGVAFKRAYKSASSTVRDTLVNSIGISAMNTFTLCNSNSDINQAIQTIFDMADSDADIYIESIKTTIPLNKYECIMEIKQPRSRKQLSYCEIGKNNYLNRLEEQYREELVEMLDKLLEISSKYNARLTELTFIMRKVKIAEMNKTDHTDVKKCADTEEELDSKQLAKPFLIDEDRYALNKLDNIKLKITSIKIVRHFEKYCIDAVKRLREKKYHIPTELSIEVHKKDIREYAKTVKLNDDVFIF